MRLTETQIRAMIRDLLSEISFDQAKQSLNSKKFGKILKARAFNKKEDPPDAQDIKEFGDRLIRMIPNDIEDSQKGEALLWTIRLFRNAANNNIEEPFMSDGVMITDFDNEVRRTLELYFQRKDYMEIKDINSITSKEQLVSVVEKGSQAYYKAEEGKIYLDSLKGTVFLTGGVEVENGKMKLEMQDISHTARHGGLIKFPVMKYDENGDVVAIINNKGASCTLGAGTDWCTAAKGLDYFEQYYKPEDPLFFFMDSNGTRYQFHYGSQQFMDIYDMEVSDEDRREMSALLLRVGGSMLEEKYPNVVLRIKLDSKDTTAEDLMKYAKQSLEGDDLKLQYRILTHDNASREMRDLMVDSKSFKVVNYLAQADVSPETLIKLATMATSRFEGSNYDMYNPDLIKNLISNRDLPTEAVDMIAGYRKASTGVAQLAAEHPNISVEALERMLQALKDIGVKSAPSLNAIALNRKTTPEMLLSIVDLDLNDFELVRYLVANPNIPQEAHVKLFNKWKNIPGITSIIEAPGLPVDLLKKFVEEKPDKTIYLVNSPESEFLEHLFYINNRKDSPIPEDERRAINMELATNRYLPQSLIRQMLEKETDRQNFPQQVHDNLAANPSTELLDLREVGMWNPEQLDDLDQWSKQYFAKRPENQVIDALYEDSINNIDSETQRYSGENAVLREALAANRHASWETLSKMIYDPRQGETVRMLAIDNVLKGSLPDIHKQYLIDSLGIKPFKEATGEETYRFNRWSKQSIKDEDSHEGGWWRMSFTPNGERANTDFNRIQRLTAQKLNQMRTTGRYHDQIGGLYSPLQRREAGLPPLEKETLSEGIFSKWQRLAGLSLLSR